MCGKRPRHAEFQNVGLGERLFHVLVGRSAANYADLARIALNAVEIACFHELAHGGHARIEGYAPRLGISGHHDPLRGVLFIGFWLNLYTLPYLNGAFGMRNAHSRANHTRKIETLGNIVGRLGKRQCLGGVGGVEHGNMGRTRIEARVLLVLGGMHSGVVGGKNHETAVHSRIRRGEQGVGGHVDADVLHRGQHATTSGSRPQTNFDGNLFIWGPFGIHARQFGEGLHGLGRRGARIRHPDACSGFPRAARDGLVS